MRISPHDIRQQQFTVRMFRGTDRQEVDSFLEDVADDYETLLKEHQLLKEQLAAMEDRQRGVLDRERSLNETLVTTQRLVDGRPAPYSGETIVVGALDAYEARCRDCHSAGQDSAAWLAA